MGIIAKRQRKEMGNNRLLAPNQVYIFLLELLELSTAFNTIHHAILLDKLEIVGVRTVALSQLRSCLTDYYKFVDVNGDSFICI